MRCCGRVARKIPAAALVETHVADGHALPYGDAAFDGAFSAFCIAQPARPAASGLAELRRVVRPGEPRRHPRVLPTRTGRDFFFDKIYNAHVLPLVGWAVTGDREAYRYLPRSDRRVLRSLGEFAAALQAAGFDDIEGLPLFPAGVASMVVAS